MSWHESIDDALAEFSTRENIPTDLALAQPLYQALRHVENRSTNDPRTLRTVQAMAECAVHPMVTDLAHSRDDGLVTQLRGMNSWWHDRSTLANTSAHNTLSRVSMYYSPYAGEGIQPYELGSAIYSASHLMEYAYPIDYANPSNPEARPLKGDMLHAISLFAVTSQVHLTECGTEKNQAAIQGLVQNMTVAE